MFFLLCVSPESGADAASASLPSICHYSVNNQINLHKGGILHKKIVTGVKSGVFTRHHVFFINTGYFQSDGATSQLFYSINGTAEKSLILCYCSKEGHRKRGSREEQ